MAVFTDRIDVDVKISLYEYGFIRNPLTNKTVMCVNTADYLYGGQKPKVKVLYISQDGVLERLEEMEDGFFSYIGENKEDVMGDTMINSDDLTYLIMTMNTYDGSWEI